MAVEVDYPDISRLEFVYGLKENRVGVARILKPQKARGRLKNVQRTIKFLYQSFDIKIDSKELNNSRSIHWKFIKIPN